MSKVLITGCAGFIGTHLTKRFLDAGDVIYGIDNLSRRGSKTNLNWINSDANASKFHFYDYDIREFDVSYLSKINAESVPFEVLLDRSDIVTVHVPLNSMTKGLFNSEIFKSMKSNAVFINTCRGPVHDEKALIRALDQREIAAAGLDVFEEEPTPTSNPLLNMDNVIVTPHLAGSSQERVDNAIIFSYENARRVLRGRKPENCVVIDE